AMAINRERRVIGNLVVEIKPTEPAVGQMQLNLLTQPPLKANAVAVANDQHPDHKLGINRRPANIAIEEGQFLAYIGPDPRHDWIDPAQQLVSWNALFGVEKIA